MSVRVVCTSIFHILVGYSISLDFILISIAPFFQCQSNIQEVHRWVTKLSNSDAPIHRQGIQNGFETSVSKRAWESQECSIKSVLEMQAKKNVISPPLWSARQHPIGGNNQKTRKGQLNTKVDLQANGLINTSRISTVIIEKNNLYYYMTNYIHKDQ